MIKYISIFLQFLCFTAYAQSEIKVREILIEKYTQKPDSTYNLPLWSFEKDMSKVEKLNLPIILFQLKSKEFYKADFFFLDDLHGFQSSCIIMYDNVENSLIMLKPMWYSGLSEEFYKNFIGIQLISKKEIKNFSSEFEKLIMNGSGKLIIRKTEFESNSITFKISHDDQERIFDIIKIILKDDRIFEIQRIEPKDLSVSEKIN